MSCETCENRTFTMNNERFRITLVALFAAIAIILGVIVGLANHNGGYLGHESAPEFTTAVGVSALL